MISQSLRTIDRPFVFRKTIVANTLNYNLRNDAIAAGWNGQTRIDAVVDVNSGVFIYSDNTGIAAFDTGSIPANSKLRMVNRGFIMGRGGNGGDGATQGGNGGHAINMQYPITIDTTQGYILGGGGGGGGARYGGLVAGGGGGAGGGNGGIVGAGGLPGLYGAACNTYPYPGGSYASGAGGGRIVTGNNTAQSSQVNWFQSSSASTPPNGGSAGGQAGVGLLLIGDPFNGGNTDASFNYAIYGGFGAGQSSVGGNASIGSTGHLWTVFGGGGGGGYGSAGGYGTHYQGTSSNMSPGVGGYAIAKNGNQIIFEGSSSFIIGQVF